MAQPSPVRSVRSRAAVRVPRPALAASRGEPVTVGFGQWVTRPNVTLPTGVLRAVAIDRMCVGADSRVAPPLLIRFSQGSGGKPIYRVSISSCVRVAEKAQNQHHTACASGHSVSTHGPERAGAGARAVAVAVAATAAAAAATAAAVAVAAAAAAAIAAAAGTVGRTGRC